MTLFGEQRSPPSLLLISTVSIHLEDDSEYTNSIFFRDYRNFSN